MLCKYVCKSKSPYRILHKEGFDHVVCEKKLEDKNFRVFFINNLKVNSRLGILVPKKIISNSVKRNYLKRIIRNVFRNHSIVSLKIDVVVSLKYSFKINSNDLDVNLISLFNSVQNKCVNLL